MRCSSRLNKWMDMFHIVREIKFGSVLLNQNRSIIAHRKAHIHIRIRKHLTALLCLVDLLSSWASLGVRTACWWAAAWATSTADWPSSALWWVTPASMSVRPFSEAAVSLQSVPGLTCMYKVRNITQEIFLPFFYHHNMVVGIFLVNTLVSHSFTPLLLEKEVR